MPSTAAPIFLVTSGFWQTLPQMPLEQYPGTEGFIDDVDANPNGVPMCSGYFELRNTDAPLDYYYYDYDYDYDEMKIVLEGEFRLENPDTGQVRIAKAKDAICFPKGSRILFSTPDAFGAITCILSAFVSNTATVAMLLPTALGILAVIAKLLQKRVMVEPDFDRLRLRVGAALSGSASANGWC